MPGWIDNSEKHKFWSEIDLFVSPSLDEPFGIVFLEAMQAGVPIIASNTVGAREIFTHRKTALVVRIDDHLELASSIKALIDDREFAKALVREAALVFNSRYCLAAVSSELDLAIKKIIQLKSSAMGPQTDAG